MECYLISNRRQLRIVLPHSLLAARGGSKHVPRYDEMRIEFHRPWYRGIFYIKPPILPTFSTDRQKKQHPVRLQQTVIILVPICRCALQLGPRPSRPGVSVVSTSRGWHAYGARPRGGIQSRYTLYCEHSITACLAGTSGMECRTLYIYVVASTSPVA